jgi:hypothetical protein
MRSWQLASTIGPKGTEALQDLQAEKIPFEVCARCAETCLDARGVTQENCQRN